MHTTREAWLHDFTRRAAPWFEEAGYPLPSALRISCGFPSRAATARVKRRIGECWPAEASRDGVFELLISPTLDDLDEVTATLVHELLHAAVGLEHGHNPKFSAAAKRMGLEGPPTATRPGPEFRRRVAPILEALGPYPHGRLILERGRTRDGSPEDGEDGGEIRSSESSKKQKARMHKAACEECGYTVRVARKWLDVGPPLCPSGHGAMEADAGEGDGE